MLFLLAAIAGGAYLLGRAIAAESGPPTLSWGGYGVPPAPAALPAGGGSSPAGLPAPKAGEVQLIPGTRYRASLVLSGIEAAASNSMVAAELGKLMKGPVSVWDSRPATWAVATPDASFFESVRWAEAIYQGAPRNVRLPAVIRKVWTA
jgi:hypothetical protein